jgi:hypothetical protein
MTFGERLGRNYAFGPFVYAHVEDESCESLEMLLSDTRKLARITLAKLPTFTEGMILDNNECLYEDN